MELFEKINRAFGGWYEGLFGGSEDVRPRDILRKILVALEEHRKEGIDNRVYVPNQFVLEIAVNDQEEKEYLLSFLDRDELETAIRRYCQQNQYHIRGALDFTIREVEPADGEGIKRRDKVRVRCRYDSRLAATKPEAAPSVTAQAAVFESAMTTGEEDATVYEVRRPRGAEDSESGTVPAVAEAVLEVTAPGRPPFEAPILRGVASIGRSSRAANDVVLEHDGLVSRRHARIERESDGRFTVYDLDTTNGTRVNGRRIENAALADGDEIEVGATRIRFRQLASISPGKNRSTTSGRQGTPARIVLLNGNGEDEFVLASQTLVGRAVTSDVVLSDRSVATRHARIVRGEPFTLESLDADASTRLNGEPVPAFTPVPLADGQVIELGTVRIRFEADRP